MKPPVLILLVLAYLSPLDSQLSTLSAQGTAFTYQGRLNDANGPANGSYDLTFTLFNTNTTGVASAGPVTNSATAVSNGLFTVAIDFGTGIFTGSSNWLEIAVQTNGGSSFTTLAPRQQFTPTPYAITAANISGSILLTQLPTAVVTNGASAVNISGTFTGNGAGLTNLPAVLMANLLVPTNNTTQLWISGLGTVNALGGPYNASAGNGEYVRQGPNSYTNVAGNGYGFLITGGMNLFLTNSDYPSLFNYISKDVPFTPGLPTWLDHSGAGLAMVGVYGTNLVTAPQFLASTNIISTNLSAGTMTVSNVTLLGSVSNLYATLSLTSQAIGRESPTVLVSSNATLSGSAGLLTNAPATGWIWNQMPVPALMMSTFVSEVCNNSESLVVTNILNAKTNGMWAAGWKTILVEDGQYAPSLDASNNLVADPALFPGGFPFLVNVAHTNGFKIAGYSSGGTIGCCNLHDPGTPFALLAQHIQQHVIWGFDGMTMDACGVLGNSIYQRALNIIRTFNAVAFDYGWDYTSGVANRGMFLIMNLNDGTGSTMPFEALYGVNCLGINTVYPGNDQPGLLLVARQCITNSAFVGPGHYLNPTSFRPDDFGTNLLQQYLDVYYMTASPIQIGILPPSAASLLYLTNTEALAIQQDSAVVPCWVASSNNLAEVWVRPLGGITANTPIYGTVRPPLPMTTSNAVLIINESTTNQTTTVTAAMLGQPVNAPITIRDPWTHTTVSNFTGSFSWTVGPTNMVLLTTFPATFTGNNGVFTGDGSGLTNLSASSLTSGTIPTAQMPALQTAYPNALTNNQTGSTIVSNLTAETITNRAVGATKVVITDASGKEVGAALSGITLIGTTLTASAVGFIGNSTQFGVSGSVTSIKSAALVTNLVSSGTIALVESGGAFATDASLGTYFRGTLTGNDTLSNPTNPRDGERVTWELIQDGSGNRTITMDTKFAFGADITSITLTTTASKRDFITAVYNSMADKWFVVGFTRGY